MGTTICILSTIKYVSGLNGHHIHVDDLEMPGVRDVDNTCSVYTFHECCVCQEMYILLYF